jgi:hypothetical protein
MSETSPQPNTGTEAEKSKIRAVISQRRLTGCANDVKWGKLLDAMRHREDWTPSYRYKCVDGLPSQWDAEWWYHLPFPMMSVEWFDIATRQTLSKGHLFAAQEVDHSDWIIQILNDATFCYDVIEDVIRIFGYLPKSFDSLQVKSDSDGG